MHGRPEWDDLPTDERARRKARQGVAYELEEDVRVLDPDTCEPVPWDGKTSGEIAFRGNIVMKGYLKQEETTEEAFKNGWFWSGDIAVQHPDGYIRDPRPRQGHHHLGRARTSARSRSRTPSTLIRPWGLPRSWPCRTRSGAKSPAPSSNWPKAPVPPRTSYSNTHAPGWPGFSVPRRSSSANSPRHRRAKILKTELRKRV